MPCTARAVVALAAAALVTGCGAPSGTGGSTPAGQGSPTSTSTAPAATSATSPAASASGAVVPRSVAIIGDSLTFQNGNGQTDVTAALVKAGWPAKGICWSGADGRTVVDTLPGGAPSAQAEVVRCRKQLGEPQLWVIALVSNNLGQQPAELRADMRKLLAVLGPDARVLWVNAARSDLSTQNILTLDPVLADTLRGRPHTTIADWYGFLKSHPHQQGWWQADGTHMTRAGYAQRNAFVAQQARAALSS